jgi:hypothetical protein
MVRQVFDILPPSSILEVAQQVHPDQLHSEEARYLLKHVIPAKGNRKKPDDQKRLALS